MLPPPIEAAPSATLLSSLLSIAAALPTTPPAPYPSSFHAPSAAASQPHAPPHGECRLLGPFALLVQLALGGLALLALVYKRWRERPQRPVKVWGFDVSKQVVGSVLVHAANLMLSLLSSGLFGVTLETVVVVGNGEGREPNPCSFYFLNLLIDVSLSRPLLSSAC
jgi:hypothetical protein